MAARSSPSRSTRCSPAALPATVARRGARDLADRLDGACAPTRCGCDALPGPAADRPGREPALQRLGARAAAPARGVPVGRGTGWSWCRPRSPTGSPPARRARPTASRRSRRAWYARRRAGPASSAATVFWPVPNVDSGLVAFDPPRAAGDDRDPRRGLRRASTPRSPSAARRCGPRWPAGPARPTPPNAALRAAGVDPRRRGEVEQLGGRRGTFARPIAGASPRPRLGREAMTHRARWQSGHRAGARQGQPRSSRWARCAPDGYHDLATVYHAVSLFDDVTSPPRAEPATAAARPVEGDGAEQVPARRHEPRGPRGAAAALGRTRASSDGSGCTSARASRSPAAWPAAAPTPPPRCSPATRCGGPGSAATSCVELAAELGTDVPFALLGGTAIGTGRGERLTPALARGHLPLGVRARRRRAVDPRGLRRARPAPRRRACCPSRACSDELMQALRAGDAGGAGRGALPTTCSRRRCRCCPTSSSTLRRRRRVRRARRRRLRVRPDRASFLARDDRARPRPRRRAHRVRRVPRRSGARTARCPARASSTSGPQGLMRCWPTSLDASRTSAVALGDARPCWTASRLGLDDGRPDRRRRAQRRRQDARCCACWPTGRRRTPAG